MTVAVADVVFDNLVMGKNTDLRHCDYVSNFVIDGIIIRYQMSDTHHKIDKKTVVSEVDINLNKLESVRSR